MRAARNVIRLTNEGTGQLIVCSLTATSHPTRKLCQLGQLASSSWETSKSFFLQNSLLLPSNSQAFHQYSPPKLPPAIQELLVQDRYYQDSSLSFSLAHPEEFPPLLSRFIPAQRYPFARTPNLCSPDRIRLFPALTQPAPWHSLLLHFHRQYSSTAPTTLICLPWCRSLRCKAGCYLSQIACPSQ